MAQIRFEPPSAAPVCVPTRIQPHVRPRRTLAEVWREARHRRFQATARLCKTTNILRDSLRSLRGRIRLQSARDWIVGYGPAFQQDRTGCLVPNIRSNARAEYTEKLAATHPWVDSVDLKMFLEGFDAGEEWARRTQDSGGNAASQSGS